MIINYNVEAFYSRVLFDYLRERDGEVNEIKFNGDGSCNFLPFWGFDQKKRYFPATSVAWNEIEIKRSSLKRRLSTKNIRK